MAIVVLAGTVTFTGLSTPNTEVKMLNDKELELIEKFSDKLTEIAATYGSTVTDAVLVTAFANVVGDLLFGIAFLCVAVFSAVGAAKFFKKEGGTPP